MLESFMDKVYIKNFINRIYSITPANNGLDLSILPDIVSFSINEAKRKKEEIKKDFNKDEFVSLF